MSAMIAGITDANRGAFTLVQDVMNHFSGCGICEEIGAERGWSSSFSWGAHSVCYKNITPIEADLVAKINDAFQSNADRNLAHARAIKAVKEELGDFSIKAFLETNGAERLKSIFDTSGVKAALSGTPNA